MLQGELAYISEKSYDTTIGRAVRVNLVKKRAQITAYNIVQIVIAAQHQHLFLKVQILYYNIPRVST